MKKVTMKTLFPIVLTFLLLFNSGTAFIANADTLTLNSPAIQSAPGFNSVILAWERVADAEAYDIYLSDAAQGTYELAEADVKSTQFQVHFSNGKKLLGNVTYYFKVKAKNKTGVSDFSNVTSAKTNAFNPADGWASTGSGTTGGDLGQSYVVVTSTAELKAKIDERKDTSTGFVNSPPLTIYVKGLLTGSTDITLQNVHNISLVGLGSDAVIDGYGLVFKGSGNVIVRNLTIKNGSTKGVDVQSSDHIYFEHNNFSRAVDGLTDVKSASDFVTMSWNRYSNHEKTFLIGSGWNATSTDRGKLSVSIHHNWFDGTQERHPRVRFGKVHVYNNYYSNIINYGAASTSEAQVLLEGNYFENVPIVAMYSRSRLDKSLNNLLSNDPLGLLKVTDTNKIVGTGGEYDELLEATYEDAANVPNRGKTYSWTFNPSTILGYVFTLDSADKAKQDIEKYAGIEKKPVFSVSTIERPSNLKYSYKAGGIDLTWDAVQGANKYVVKYATAAAGPFTEVITSVPSVTLPIGNVVIGSTYYASVTASNDKAISLESSLLPMNAAIPAVPAKPKLQRLDQSFAVSWTEVPLANSYFVTMTNKLTNATVVVPNVTGAVYTFANLDAGTAYSFTVKAMNYFGSSANSAVAEDKAVASIKYTTTNWMVNDNFNSVTEATPIGDYGYVQDITGTPGASVGENYVKFLNGDVDGSNKGSMSLFLKDSSKDLTTAVYKDLTKNTTGVPYTGKFILDLDFKEAPPEDSKPIRLLDSDGKVVVSLKVDSQAGNLLYSIKNGTSETNTDSLLVLNHNVWYNIKVVADTETKLVDIYINGSLYLAGAPFYDTTAKNIATFRGETSNNGIKPIQYRNVKAGILTSGPSSVTITSLPSTMIVGERKAITVLMTTYGGVAPVDVTKFATYNTNPAGIVQISSDGQVTASSAGTTVVTATYWGITSTPYQISVNRIYTSSSSSSSSTGSTGGGTSVPVPQSNESSNGTITAEVKTVNGKQVAQAKVDDKAIENAMKNSSGGKLSLVVDANANATQINVTLTNSALQKMAADPKVKTVVIITSTGSYELPMKSIHIQELSSKLGTAKENVNVEISMSKNDAAADKAKVSGQKALAAVEFTVKASSTDGKGSEITSFNQYVQRSIKTANALNERNVAAVRVETDSKGNTVYQPVPFTVTGTEATLFSRSNSTYMLLENHVSFADVTSHWAKDEIERMANKMIVQGVSNDEFRPDQAVTRAEFAALIARTMGLKPLTDPKNRFTDVRSADWFDGQVHAVAEAGIVTGYDDQTFRPDQKISRQEMAVMIYRAMKYAGFEDGQKVGQDPRFEDESLFQDWAKEAIVTIASYNIVSGVESGKYDPAATATRAQSSAILNRMLSKLKFTN